MKVIFFSKGSKFYVHFENAIKRAENLMILKIIAFELVVEVSVKYGKNTCYRP